MGRTFLLLLIVIAMALFFGCQSENKNPNRSDDSSGVANVKANKENIIGDYRLKEKFTWDSIKYFELDSVVAECLKLLYVGYGKEKVIDSDSKQEITIGECDIRLHQFKYLGPFLRRFDFEVFFKDSLPVNALFTFDKLGSMNNSFTVDVKKKEIINASANGTIYTSMKDFTQTINEVIKDPSFKSYVEKNSQVLHPKFKNILSRYHILPN
jgi:hypothetical protein